MTAPVVGGGSAGDVRTGGSLRDVVASELLRLRRRGFVLSWLGLTAGVAALIDIVMFQVVENGGTPPADGPGVSFPAASTLLSSHGIASGLAAASSMFGVVTLAFWALATAGDYSSGLVRVLVAAEPRRGRLLLGKWLALAVCTAGTTVVAVLVDVLVAPVAARAAGFDPGAWGTDLAPILGGAALNLLGALLVWGTIGLALATVTRSAGIAIGVGIGDVLLLEVVITAAVSSVGRWLPGTTIAALAHGGTPHLSYVGAVTLAVVDVAVAAGAALVVVTRRDITD